MSSGSACENALVNVLTKYCNIKSTLTFNIQIASHDWVTLNRSLPVRWFPYGQFLWEHSRELSNSINEFRYQIGALMAWNKVVNELDQETKVRVIAEFVGPIATAALMMPYVIRSRFIYSASHLCHQANRLKHDSWKDDLPVNEEIYFGIADRYGKHWSGYSNFKCALEKIANKRHREETNDFRNKFNHRYSPRIEVGLTELVSRYIGNDGTVSYALGSSEPLKLKKIVPLLVDQHGYCLRAHEKYVALVDEQIDLIHSSI